jgi:hypothetical protein
VSAFDEAPPPVPPDQPTHEELLARLAAMRPVQHGPELPRASFEEIQARILAAQEALPVQHCGCGATFRHQRPGRCHDCTVAARRGA